MKILISIFCLTISISAYAVDFNVSWSAPTSKENGTSLDLSEIGGYQIKYKCGADDEQSILLTDNSLESHSFSYSTNAVSCNFSIAAYDVNNLIGVFSPGVSVDILKNISQISATILIRVTITESNVASDPGNQ